MYFSRPLHAWAALTLTGALSVRIPSTPPALPTTQASASSASASKSDEPALREVSDQFLTDWTELDWNKV